MVGMPWCHCGGVEEVCVGGGSVGVGVIVSAGPIICDFMVVVGVDPR